MKWHCSRGLFYLLVACWFGIVRNGGAQNNPAQIPQPVSSVAVMQDGALDDYLKFDAEAKMVSVTNGTAQAHFEFSVTNVSSGDVIINSIVGSCSCTKAQLP